MPKQKRNKTNEYLSSFVEKLKDRFGSRLTEKEWKEIHSSARGFAGGKISRPMILKPYSSVSELPSDVRESIPVAAQKLFLRVVNQALYDNPKDEPAAFKQAWEALSNAGWEKDGDRWRRKADVNKSCTLAQLYVPPRIPSKPRVVFVDLSPSSIEAARGVQMVGPVGVEFRKQYLDPIGLSRKDAAFISTVPIYLTDNDGKPRVPNREELEMWIPELQEQLKNVEGLPVVAISRKVRDLLDNPYMYLPHPEAVRKFGQKDNELTRKICVLKKHLTKRRKCASICTVKKELLPDIPRNDSETKPDTPAKPPKLTKAVHPIVALRKEHGDCAICKRDEDLRISYHAVLKPGIKDKQGHVVSKEEIEKACRDYMLKSQVVGDGHEGPCDAKIVECWIGRTELGYEPTEEYPDGTWFIGIYEPDPEKWEREKEVGGGAVSIGGLGELSPR